jgi:hypothetical protein
MNLLTLRGLLGRAKFRSFSSTGLVVIQRCRLIQRLASGWEAYLPK